MSIINLNEEFHKAVAEGDIDGMDLLLEAGANVNCLNKHKQTALYVAVKNEYIDIYTSLIYIYKICYMTDTNLLKLVCQNDNLNVFSFYPFFRNIHYSFTIVDTPFRNRQLLHFFAMYNCHRICKFYLRNFRGDVNKKDLLGYSVLHEACKSSNLEIVQLLCEHGGIKINQIDFLGRTPFFYACLNDNNIDIVRYLISRKGIQLDKTDKKEDSPFAVACHVKAYKIVAELLLHPEVNKTYDHPYVQDCYLEKPELFPMPIPKPKIKEEPQVSSK